MIDGEEAAVDGVVDMELCEEYKLSRLPNDDVQKSKKLRAQKLQIEILLVKL